MSSIDERVVEMKFDNKQFEAGAKQTMNTLDELQESLQLEGSTRGLQELQRSINSFSVLSMTDSINTIAERFSTMGIIATTALVNITNRAIAAGEALLKSLTVDNIAAGWEKFSKDTVSVGTLISQGYDLSYVEDQLKRLMNFSDETSYHYSDMVDTLGKFTAAGRNLEDSITAMQGIALWAASTGQNAQIADRAMVQLAQAMGAGQMRRQDWMSIQTLNMDTDQFRQVALDTAVALGKLKKTGEDTYKSLLAKTKQGAQEFKKSQFAESLTQGAWFDYEVMMGVYEKYGSAVKVVDEYMAKHADTINTVSEAIRTLEEEQTGKIEEYAKSQQITTEEATKQLLNFDEAIKKYADDNKVSLEEAAKAMDKYRLSVDPMALTWYKAGQEARTFEDVIVSVKDAVSTKLMAIMKDVVGNYEEATELFSNMADALYEIFVAPIDQVKELMDMWHDFGGRVHMLHAFKHIWDSILKVTTNVGEAFKNIFPGETTWQGLVKATFEFSKFTKAISISEETAQKVGKIFEGLFSIFDLVGQVFSAVTRTIAGFIPAIRNVVGGFLDGAVSIATFIKDMATAARESDIFYNTIQSLINYVSPAFEFVSGVISKAIELFEKFTGIDLHIPTFKEFSDTISNIGKFLEPLTNLFGAAANAVRNFFVGLNNPTGGNIEKKLGIFERIGEIFSKIGKFLKPIFDDVVEAIDDFLTDVSRALDRFDFGMVAGGAAGFGVFSFIYTSLYDFIWDLYTLTGGKGGAKVQWVENLKYVMNVITTGISDMFRSFGDNVKAKSLKEIATAMLILAGAMFVLSTIETDKMIAAVVAITFVMKELTGALTVISGIDLTASAPKLAAIAFQIIGIAAALLIMSAAAKVLGSMELGDLAKGTVAIGALLFMMQKFVAAMEFYSTVGGMKNAMKGIVSLSVAVLILSAAVHVIGKLPWQQALQGVIGVGLILAELGVFLHFAGAAKHVIGTGVALLAIATSLLVITGVLAIMGKFSKTMGTGLLVMGAALIELATALHFMESSLPGAAAMLVCAAAMVILAPALVLLGKALNGDQVGIMIMALAGALLTLVAAAGLGQYLVGPLLAIGAAVAMLGVGMLAGSVALGVFSVNFSLAVQSFIGAAAMLGKAKLVEAIQIFFNSMVDAFINGIINLIKSIVLIIPKVAEIVVAFIDAFLATLADHLPSIVDSIGAIATALLIGLNKYLPDIVDAGILLAVGFVYAVADGLIAHQDEIFGALGALTASIINFALSAIEIFAKDLPVIGDTVAAAIEELKGAVTEALDPRALEEAAGIGAESVTHEIETLDGTLITMGGESGGHFGESLGKGIEESSDKAKYGVSKTAEEIGKEFDENVAVWDEKGEQINEHLKSGMDISSYLPEGSADNIKGLIDRILGDTSGYEQMGINGITAYANGWDNPEQKARLKGILSDISGPSTEGVMRKNLKSHSPSKVTYKIGIDAGKGYILGLEDSKEGVKDAAGKLADTTKSEIGILDYADGAVGAFMNHWALMQDNISDTDAFQASKDAIELLALQMYAASDASKQAVTDAEGNATAVEDILNGIKKTYTDMRNSIIQTMDSQTDMFSMFDFGEAVRPEEMLENMESNLRAIDTYYQNIETLTERGIDDGLLRHLEELGPKGAAQMRSFIQMTDEQLEKANQMWQEKGEKMSHAADHVIGALAYSGVQTAGGFVDGLDPETGEVAAQTYIEAALQKMRETVGVNLQNFEAVGGEVADSVAKGITKSSESETETDKAAKTMSSDVVGTVDSNVKKEDGVAIGYRLCEGIAQGLRDGIEIATTAAEEMALRLIQIVKDTLGIASPSKAFMELGYYSDEGLAQGFIKYGTVVREAAAESALGAVNEMSGVFGRIADLIDGTIDLDPTIRPVLDLSNIQYGASQIGSLLGLNDPYALNAVGTISGIQNDAQLMAGLTNSLTDAINGMKSDNDLPPVTINIYPKEGQSAEEIAEVVSWKFNHDVLKRRAAYGGAR